jgi:hypothetical protein
MSGADFGRIAVKVWAVMMLIAGFLILVSEAGLHFCHTVLSAICTTDGDSLTWIIVGFVTMLLGGLILWRERVSPALQSIEGAVPFVISIINSIRGRRSTDAPATTVTQIEVRPAVQSTLPGEEGK